MGPGSYQLRAPGAQSGNAAGWPHSRVSLPCGLAPVCVGICKTHGHKPLARTLQTFAMEHIVRKISIITLLFLVVLILTIKNACCMDAKEIFKAANESVVVIESLDERGNILGMGTGFFAGDGDKIVTNAHVITGASSVKCKLQSGEEFIAERLSYINFDHDIAIILSPRKGKPLQVLRSEVEVGENVFVIGNPLGLERSFSTGIVSGRRAMGNYKVIQISAPISPGNSGGPVLNSDCNVVGVSRFFIKEGQNLNFAVDANSLNLPISSKTDIAMNKLTRGISKLGSDDLPPSKTNYSPPPEGFVNDGVRKFIESLVSIHRVEELESIKSSYSDSVSYYGKQMSKDEVFKSKKAFFKRWSFLDYRIADFKMQQTEDSAVMHVTCRINYTATNDTKTISGVSESYWDIKDIGARYSVVGENSKVLERY